MRSGSEVARLRRLAFAAAVLAAAGLVAVAARPLDAWGVLTAWVVVSLVTSAALAAALPERTARASWPRAHRPRGIEEDPARRLLQRRNLP